MDVTNAKALAATAGRSYVVRAVANIHGESDDAGYATNHPEFPAAGPADYGAALIQWQKDLETTVKAVTNQTQPVPMFISQLSGWYRTTTSKVAQYQLDAHVAAPGKVILIGPSYPYDINGSDCLHYTSASSRRIGEYFAKVYTKVVLGGEAWEPVRPKKITRVDNVVPRAVLRSEAAARLRHRQRAGGRGARLCLHGRRGRCHHGRRDLGRRQREDHARQDAHRHDEPLLRAEPAAPRGSGGGLHASRGNVRRSVRSHDRREESPRRPARQPPRFPTIRRPRAIRPRSSTGWCSSRHPCSSEGRLRRPTRIIAP